MDQRVLLPNVATDGYGAIRTNPSSSEANETTNKNGTKNKSSNRLNILGFFFGVLSSLMAATGSSCAQVSFDEKKLYISSRKILVSKTSQSFIEI